MSPIRKIYERFRRGDARKTESKVPHESDLSIDHQINGYQRGPDEHWNFKDGRIYVNDEDVEHLVDKNPNDTKLLSAVTDAVSEYRDVIYKKSAYAYENVNRSAERILDKILCNMKRIYDEKTGGISLRWGDGVCLVNKLNVRAFLALYHVRPTEKARRFLVGLRSRLALILCNKGCSPHYERVAHVVKTLYDEVEDAIHTSPIDGRYLSGGRGNNIG